MAYILEKIGNTYNLPKKYFTCDAKSDLDGISLVDVPIGSEAYCILEEESYILDSNKQWHKKKIGEDLTGQVQADWNQNDESASSYIKNRTHYSEFVEGIVKNYCLQETTFTNSQNPCISANLVTNNQYIVECNGEIYNVIAQDVDLNGIQCIGVGNIGIMTNGNNTGEPFLYLQVPSDMVASIGAEALVYNPLDSSSMTISIYTESWGMVENIHHIDHKYIKDMYYENSYIGTIVENKLVTGFVIQQEPIYSALLPIVFEPIVGETYTITWDGVNYECVASISNSVVYIGNENYVILQSGGDIPFAIIYTGGRILLLTESTDASHTISIAGIITNTRKIDKKYLPETIVNISRGSNGYKADLTFSEIRKNANNSAVFAIMDGITYNLAYTASSKLVFTNTNKTNAASTSVYLSTLVINSDDSITTNNDILQTSANLSGKLLPTAYSSDNGKVLTVKNGAWEKVAPASGLPTVTTSDNGKFLRVINGVWTAAIVPNAEEVAF